MLKWYAETFKLTEKQMTGMALRRIWVLTAISLLLVPAILIREIYDPQEASSVLVNTMFYIGLVGFFCLAFTKFMNRFWSRDKYLDEWEKERKHEAMAFAFQIMQYIVMAILLIIGFSPIFGYGQDILFGEFGHRTLGFIVMGFGAIGIFAMHLYLLVTTKPINSLDELRADLSIDEVI